MPTSHRTEKITQVIQNRQKNLTVIFDDIVDPHNAAAVLRTCDAFGIQEVHFIFSQQPKYNLKQVGKASSSSANKWLDIKTYDSSADCIEELHNQDYHIIATALHSEATSIYDADLHSKPIALLFGNEHAGLSEETLQLVDEILLIPMMGMIESLNLSVTAGICLFEATRQRKQHNTVSHFSPSEQSKLIEDFLQR